MPARGNATRQIAPPNARIHRKFAIIPAAPPVLPVEPRDNPTFTTADSAIYSVQASVGCQKFPYNSGAGCRMRSVGGYPDVDDRGRATNRRQKPSGRTCPWTTLQAV